MKRKLTFRLKVVAMGGVCVLAIGWRVPLFGFEGGRAQDRPAVPAPAQAENPQAPAKPVPPEERGDIFMARKNYADAVDYYSRALKQPNLSPRDAATLWNKVGIAFQEQMNYVGARKAYKESIRRRADFAEPLNNLGTTYYLDNKFKKSVKYYLSALKLDPNSASYCVNLGTAYYRLKKYNLAVEEYRTALTLDPNILTQNAAGGTVMETREADADFYFYLAKSFALVGRVDEAVRYLRRAFEEGFKDQKRLETDPDFQKVSQNPAYVELLKHPPVAIRE